MPDEIDRTSLLRQEAREKASKMFAQGLGEKVSDGHVIRIVTGGHAFWFKLTASFFVIDWMDPR